MDRELLRAQLVALRATVDASLLALGGADDLDDLDIPRACPSCPNTNPERIEDTSAGGRKRFTCLECGASWTLEVVANG